MSFFGNFFAGIGHGISNAASDAGNFFEHLGQTIAPKDSLFGKIERSTFNTITAPVQFGARVVQGKNVIASAETEFIQQNAGNQALGLASQTKPFQDVTRAASPLTLGLTSRAQEVGNTSYKAGQLSGDNELTTAERTSYFRGEAEIGAVVGGASYFAAHSSSILSTAKTAGSIATPALLVSKLATGKGNLSDVGALTGADTSSLDALSPYWNSAKDAYNSTDVSAAPVADFSYGSSSPAPTPAPTSHTTAFVVGGLALATLSVLILRHRRAA